MTRILLSFIPTMVPCHCSLRRSSRQHTMTAVSISAWDAPITHGRVRSHVFSPSSSFPFPTHYSFVHFFDAGKLRHPTSGRLYTCRLCCEQTREMATNDKDSPLDLYEVSLLNNMDKPLKRLFLTHPRHPYTLSQGGPMHDLRRPATSERQMHRPRMPLGGKAIRAVLVQHLKFL